MDYSKYSDEELERIASGTGSTTPQEESGGFGQTLRGLGRGYLNYAGGALRGMGQAAGDLGASAINWPLSGIEHLTGKKLPHVPHPHLINENPDSMAESIGQTLGQLTGGIALPGGTGVKAAQLANRGYQALRAGQELPLIGKLLAGGAGGAIEGAAANEESRGLGSVLGGIAGTAGYAIPAAINFGRGMMSKNISKEIQNEVSRLGQHFNDRFTSHLLAGEEAGANQFLKAEKAKMNLFKKVGEGKLAYGLEKFNENPTLINAHKAQSDLNKIVSKYSRSKEGSLEADVYDEALKLKNRLLQKISNAFDKSGVGEHGAGYQQARVDYAQQAAPYLDSPTISGLLGKNKRAVQTVRPSQFADKLLQEEDFLAQAGQKHPSLLRREKTKNIIKHPITKLGAIGAASYLPYEIRKLLGAH